MYNNWQIFISIFYKNTKGIQKVINKDELKTIINDEIISTEKLIEELNDQVKPIAPDNAYGRLSRMDAMINKSVSESLLLDANAKLGKLHNALSNIDKPNFGICKSCKKPIPIARLMIIPETSFCVNCAR